MVNRFLTSREQLILAGLAAAIVLGAITLLIVGPNETEPRRRPQADASVVQPQKSPPATEKPDPAETSDTQPPATPALPPAPPTPAQLAVGIIGAVHNPGLYRLEADARVEDLLDAAGGPRPDADLQFINRSAPLLDGTTLAVPERSHRRGGDWGAVWNPAAYALGVQRALPPSAVNGADPSPPASTGDSLINLNTATREQLETLPGIGPTLARRITAYRETHGFHSVDDLDQVSGIGEKRLADIRPHVTLR